MAAGGKAHQETVVIIGPGDQRFLPDLLECWRYRDLVSLLALRDIRARYKQSALGPLWIVLNPLITMVIFTMIFGVVAKLPSGGKPYALFAFVALLPWNLFASVVSSTADSLVSNRHMIEKIYFPRLALPLSRALSHLIDFGINLFILGGILVYFKQAPTMDVLWLPLYLIFLLAFGMGMGLMVTSVAAKYRDILQIVTFGVRFWMYATPVVYSMDVVPEAWRSLYRLNPMVHVIEGFRRAFLGEGAVPTVWEILLGLALAVFVLVAGLRIFHSADSKVVDLG